MTDYKSKYIKYKKKYLKLKGGANFFRYCCKEKKIIPKKFYDPNDFTKPCKVFEEKEKERTKVRELENANRGLLEVMRHGLENHHEMRKLAKTSTVFSRNKVYNNDNINKIINNLIEGTIYFSEVDEDLKKIKIIAMIAIEMDPLNYNLLDKKLQLDIDIIIYALQNDYEYHNFPQDIYKEISDIDNKKYKKIHDILYYNTK